MRLLCWALIELKEVRLCSHNLEFLEVNLNWESTAEGYSPQTQGRDLWWECFSTNKTGKGIIVVEYKDSPNWDLVVPKLEDPFARNPSILKYWMGPLLSKTYGFQTKCLNIPYHQSGGVRCANLKSSIGTYCSSGYECFQTDGHIWLQPPNFWRSALLSWTQLTCRNGFA